MAFHAKRQGGDAFSKKVTRKDTKCFICNELIPKGSERYVSGYGNSLCDECYKNMDERRWKTGENFPCKNKRITE